MNKTYHCGTLTYSKAGLLAVCAWLLWGDFCFTIMEAVVPSILPLNLKAMNCDDWVIGVIMGVIPGVLSTMVTPVISFKSDRFRSRWGRRIPFIALTLPFLCVSLILLGCGKEIGTYLQSQVVFLQTSAPTTVIFAVIGVLMVAFQFFNVFVSSLFWYLFNDVVPAEFLARFTGMFKVVGNIAGALYQYFLFQHAETHMREIFIGASLLYFVSFTLLCLNVKEGQYPPVTGEGNLDSRGFRGVKTYLRESFCHSWYWLFFAFIGLPALSRGIKMFEVFFSREMGLTLDNIGKQGAVWSVVMVLSMYLAARFIDRWHPLRVQVYLSIFAVAGAFSSWVWVFVTMPGIYFFWLSMASILLMGFPMALAIVSQLLIQMRIYPKSRFGQFCSAGSLLCSIFSLVSGVFAGLFLDGIRYLTRGGGHSQAFAYRFSFLWTTFFALITAGIGVWVYIYWNRLGGDKEYKPPAPWSPSNTEDMPFVPIVGPQFRWLSLSLRLFSASMWIPPLCMPALIWWTMDFGDGSAACWFAFAVLPALMAVWLCWSFVERGIRRDMARSLNGEPLQNGIPHHGVLMVMSITNLLSLLIWGAHVVSTLRLKMELGCILFGFAQVIASLLLTAAVLLIWRMERGFSQTLEGGGTPSTPQNLGFGRQ